MQERDEPFTACRLFEKTSKGGNQYFQGRLGGAKVLIFKTRERADDGSPIWELKFAAAPAKKEPQRPLQREAEAFDDSVDIANEGPAPRYPSTELNDRAQNLHDDEIPF